MTYPMLLLFDLSFVEFTAWATSKFLQYYYRRLKLLSYLGHALDNPLILTIRYWYFFR